MSQDPVPPKKDFQISRSNSRALMYFENTSTCENNERMIVRSTQPGMDFPVPPPHLMQYAESESVHLNSGKTMATKIRDALARNEIDLSSFSHALEFGCANARVLRHFVDLADRTQYWGCDINSNTVIWNIENLSPPFQFFVSTTQPNLPCRDGMFDFVFACSVFTHMDDMFFGWLLEMKRIVKDNGFFFLTFLTEASVEFGLEHPNRPVGKQILNNREVIDELLQGRLNMVVVNRDASSMTYIRKDFLTSYLGRLFDIVDIVEETMAGHQTAYLLKNRVL